MEIYRAGCSYEQAIDIALPNSDVSADTPIHLGPAVFNLLRSPRMLAAVESLIGGEIYSNPIQHVRIKPPKSVIAKDDENRARVGRTHWHQDSGVGLPEADDTEMVTCWVAISEATAGKRLLASLCRGATARASHCTVRLQTRLAFPMRS